jgi:hypothetical protein
MKSVIGKAPAEWTDEVGITEIVVCPEHRMSYREIYLNNGQLPDTSEFCDCCTGECSPFCKSCDQHEEAN